MSDNKDLVSGELTKESFDDFILRLRHDCEGDGVNWHHTADAIFTVQSKQVVSGIDMDYADKICVYEDDSFYSSIDDYLHQMESHQVIDLNEFLNSGAYGDYSFADLVGDDASGQVEMLVAWDQADSCVLVITGYQYEWRHVNSHFTKDAAERFIERKKHDHRLGLRVYVDAQSYCWEFNAIKEGLMNGNIVFNDK